MKKVNLYPEPYTAYTPESGRNTADAADGDRSRSRYASLRFKSPLFASSSVPCKGFLEGVYKCSFQGFILRFRVQFDNYRFLIDGPGIWGLGLVMSAHILSS